jgi:hypothetical protein
LITSNWVYVRFFAFFHVHLFDRVYWKRAKPLKESRTRDRYGFLGPMKKKRELYHFFGILIATGVWPECIGAYRTHQNRANDVLNFFFVLILGPSRTGWDRPEDPKVVSPRPFTLGLCPWYVICFIAAYLLFPGLVSVTPPMVGLVLVWRCSFLLATYGIWGKYWFRVEKNENFLLLIFTF